MNLQLLAVLALLMTVAQAYLVVNKLWIRKHEAAVAESVSILGETLGLVPMGILTISFLAQGAWEGVVDGVIWGIVGVITVLIGTGRWVEGKRRRGFWTLVREAISLERDEVGDLARSFLRPSGAPRILRVLGQVALIDRELDERERDFIDTFAENWGIDLSWEELQDELDEEGPDFIRLRETMEEYLRQSPPASQASQLGDVLGALVTIDDRTTDDEELMLAELQGMLADYVDREGGGLGWGVAIVPQNPEQDDAVRTLLPGVERREVEGGRAYVLGPYHSARYADLIGGRYRALNIFTTVVRIPHDTLRRTESHAS